MQPIDIVPACAALINHYKVEAAPERNTSAYRAYVNPWHRPNGGTPKYLFLGRRDIRMGNSVTGSSPLSRATLASIANHSMRLPVQT